VPSRARPGSRATAADLLEELPLGKGVAVVGLELGQDALLLRHGARNEAAVLLEVELPFGLKFGALRQLLRGTRKRRLLNLLVRDGDAALLVFLAEEDVRDHLVERVILNATLLIERQRLPASPLLLLSNATLRGTLEVDVSDGGAVHLCDRGARGHLRVR
jgi:hypothetical protein